MCVNQPVHPTTQTAELKLKDIMVTDKVWQNRELLQSYYLLLPPEPQHVSSSGVATGNIW